MIQDPMLRDLFKTESAEHLQRLDEVLLLLEQTPDSTTLLEEAFREAHSLKGAARMLGLAAIQMAAHNLEDVLNQARRGLQRLDTPVINQMLTDLGVIRLRVAEAVAVEPDIRPRLSVESEIPVPQAEPAAKNPPPPAQDAVPPAPTFVAPVLQLESVRVDTRRLDELMNLVSELVVTRTRVTHRMAGIQTLQDQVAALLHQTPDLTPLDAALSELRVAYGEDVTRLEILSNALEGAVRQVRLLPLANVFKLFPRMVRELAMEQDKEVELRLEGDDTVADKRILEEIKDPLMHLLRNAVDHGIETPAKREAAGKSSRGVIVLRATRTSDMIEIEVSDDGAGLDVEAIRAAAAQRGLMATEELAQMPPDQLQALIFAPGFSTRTFVTDISGRGVGMDAVRTNVERLKGDIAVTSVQGYGTQIRIRLPQTLATLRILLLRVDGHYYGLPATSVVECRKVADSAIFSFEGRDTVLHRGIPVAVSPLSTILKLNGAAEESHEGAGRRDCVLLRAGDETFGVLVDELLDEQEMVVKPLSPVLPKCRKLRGAAILSSGNICMVLEPHGLLEVAPSARAAESTRTDSTVTEPAGRRKLILLAEDSITTRAQEIRILEGAGYEVVAATDGLDALGKLVTRRFDAVVSDINMPRMDGLELAAEIRGRKQYEDLPIILVTSLASDEDKRRGLDVGANAYITKPEFDQTLLLDCLERVIG